MTTGPDPGTWADYSGALRAILDEYARAIRELEAVVLEIPLESYSAQTALSDKTFGNMNVIMGHVIGAAHVYVDYIDDGVRKTDGGRRTHSYANATPQEAMAAVWEAFGRMVELLGRFKDWGEDELEKIQFTTRWNQRYDVEQMLEHAIVHILRHRRQIERWLAA
ncbi:MAG: DinB family protein [candidate division Zixibacteria bacterium]|nr:DinB family protein [candidate division Zixibacteria bacterium]